MNTVIQACGIHCDNLVQGDFVSDLITQPRVQPASVMFDIGMALFMSRYINNICICV